MIVIDKMFDIIITTLKTVINPEFMQIVVGGAVSVPANGYNTSVVTFSKQFKNTPICFISMSSQVPQLVAYSISDSSKTSATAIFRNTGGTSRDVGWSLIAIDKTQPPLKIGGGGHKRPISNNLFSFDWGCAT